MKKSVLVLGLYLLLFFQAAFAADKPGQSTLKATVSTPQTTISELEADQITLSFTILNSGKETIESCLADSRLLINGKEINDWIPSYSTGFSGAADFIDHNKEAMLLSGRTYRFHSLPIDRPGKPGTYKVVWESKDFQSPPLKIRVLRDRVMPAGEEPRSFALTRAIRALLPAGWKAFSEKNYDGEGVKVVRSEPVMQSGGYAGINASIGMRPDSISTFQFSLRVEPFISPAYYRQIKIDNETLRQKLIEMDNQMKDIPKRKGYYVPVTPEHKKLFAEYDRLKGLIRILPEYSFRDISVSFRTWQFHSDKTNYYSVRDKAVRAECREATQRVINFLSSYEPQKPLAGDEIYKD